MFFNRPDTPELPLPVGASSFPVVPWTGGWTHPIQHSKLHLDRFSRFRTPHHHHRNFVSDIAVFVPKRDVKLQPTKRPTNIVIIII